MKWGWGLVHRKVKLNPPVIYYRPFRIGAFTVVLSRLMFVLLVVLVLFPIRFVSLFWVTVGIQSHHLFWKGLLTQFIICPICLYVLTSLNVVTSFPWDNVGEVWDLIVSVPERCSFQFCKGGWVNCDFTSFSTVFQLYAGRRAGDNETPCAMKSVCDWKGLRLRRGSNPGPLDQQSSA